MAYTLDTAPEHAYGGTVLLDVFDPRIAPFGPYVAIQLRHPAENGGVIRTLTPAQARDVAAALIAAAEAVEAPS